jgi:hypothetical protein
MKSVIFLLALLALTVSQLSAQRFKNPKGHEFWVGFMDNSIELPQQDTIDFGGLDLGLHISVDQPTDIVIEVPLLGFSKTISVEAYASFHFQDDPDAKNMELLRKIFNRKSDVIQKNGIRVYSPIRKQFYLTAMNRRAFTTDASIALPNWAWGTEYYVMSYTNNRNNQNFARSQFLLVGLDDSTVVEITPKSRITSGASGRQKDIPYTIVLNRGETYQAQGVNDLSGSHIVSTKPVALFAGNLCTDVGGIPACDHLYEAVLPVPDAVLEDRFKKYILSGNKKPSPTSNGADIYRFYAMKPNTTIIVHTENLVKDTLRLAQAGDYTDKRYQTLFNKTTYLVEADQPIMVSQLNIGGGSGGTGPTDPFMLNYIPMDAAQSYNGNIFFMDLRTNYHQAYNGWRHYLNLAIPTANIASATLNDKPITTYKHSIATVSGEPNWSVVTVEFWYHEELSAIPNRYKLQCEECMAYFYGQAAYDSYGTSPQVGTYPVMNYTPTGNPEPIASPKPSTTLALSANPITEDTKINLNLVKATAVELSLYDLTGRTVWSKTGNYGNEAVSIPLDVKDLKAGIYLLKVSTDYDQKSLKVIVK